MSPWFPEIPGRARVRLFCLPYAGGAASIYREWATQLPLEIGVVPVELPGRHTRRCEPPIDDMEMLVAELADAIDPWTAQPYAIFGQSMGALVGFELARMLRQRGQPLPTHLFVAGKRAPNLPRSRPALHTLADDRLFGVLAELGGTPESVLADKALMRQLLPVIRADLAITEDYHYRPEPPLSCSITALVCPSDPEGNAIDGARWATETARRFELVCLPGGHFFIHEYRSVVLATIARTLQ